MTRFISAEDAEEARRSNRRTWRRKEEVDREVDFRSSMQSGKDGGDMDIGGADLAFGTLGTSSSFTVTRASAGQGADGSARALSCTVKSGTRIENPAKLRLTLAPPARGVTGTTATAQYRAPKAGNAVSTTPTAAFAVRAAMNCTRKGVDTSRHPRAEGSESAYRLTETGLVASAKAAAAVAEVAGVALLGRLAGGLPVDGGGESWMVARRPLRLAQVPRSSTSSTEEDAEAAEPPAAWDRMSLRPRDAFNGCGGED
jgi:hypothetical protein